jgi:tight adherence protein C
MFPLWLLTAFYVLAGVTIAWMLLRLWRQRRRTQSDRASQPVVTERSEPPLRPAPVTRPAESTVPPNLTILKAAAAPAPEDSSSDPQITPRPAIVSAAATQAPAWERTRLFGDLRATDAPLARVLPEDVPTARTDDLVFGDATPVFAAMLPDSSARREETRKELIAAGYYQPHAVQNLSAVRYAFMMAGVILAMVLLVLAPPRLEWLAVGSLIVLPLLGWALPRLYVRSQIAERRGEIERGMPDVLDMLNMCVSQGVTIPDALRRILRDLRGPYPALAQELRIVSEQAAIGNMHQALENFSRRMDIPEVHSFTSLLIQTEKMGTSISEALASYSDTMRESLRQRADERGNRATFQLLFPTVLCLMPAVYLFLLGPAIIDLSNFFGSGGRDALDQGARVIEQMNADRRTPGAAQ